MSQRRRLHNRRSGRISLRVYARGRHVFLWDDMRRVKPLRQAAATACKPAATKRTTAATRE